MQPDYEKLFNKTQKLIEKLLEENSGIKLQCFVDFKEIDRLIKAVTSIITQSDSIEYIDSPDELRDAFKEFKKFFDAEELYAVYEDGKLDLFSEKEIGKFNIKQIEGYEDPKAAVNGVLSPFVKEGFEYLSDVYVDEFGNYNVDTFFYAHRDKKHVDREFVSLFGAEYRLFENQLNRLYQKFPAGCITRIIVSKEMPLKTQTCGVSDILELLKKDFIDEFSKGEFDKIDYKASFERTLIHQLEEGKKSYHLDVEAYSFKEDSKKKVKYAPKKIFEFLYFALEKSVSEINAEVTKDEINFFAGNGFAEYGIKAADNSESGIKPFTLSDEYKELKEVIFSIEPDTDISKLSDNQKKSYQLLLEKIRYAINPHLKEGIDYIHEFNIDEEGNGRKIKSSFYGYKDGKKISREIVFFLKDENEEIYELLRWLCSTFPFGGKIKVIAKKDKPLEVKPCSSQDIINDIKSQFEDEIKEAVLENEGDKIVVDIKKGERSKSIWLERVMYLDCEGYLLRNGKREEIEHTTHWGSITEYEALYLTLGKSFNQMRIEVTKDDFRIFTDKEFTEFGIGKI